MAQCPSSNERLFGGAVVLEVADGCPNQKPLETDYLALAAGTSKGFDFSPNTTTSDADDGAGYVESIVTNSDFTISFEGEVRKRDRLDQYGIGKFIEYFAAELKARRQPGLWVRMKYGPVIFVGYMVITALSSDGGTNDIVTFSTEFKVGDASTIEITPASPIFFKTDLSGTLNVVAGAQLKLTVEADGGKGPYDYEWYKDGVKQNPPAGSNVANEYTKTAAAQSDAGKWYALAIDANKQTQKSNIITVTIS